MLNALKERCGLSRVFERILEVATDIFVDLLRVTSDTGKVAGGGQAGEGLLLLQRQAVSEVEHEEGTSLKVGQQIQPFGEANVVGNIPTIDQCLPKRRPGVSQSRPLSLIVPGSSSPMVGTPPTATSTSPRERARVNPTLRQQVVALRRRCGLELSVIAVDATLAQLAVASSAGPCQDRR